jgi:hypothetical protein
MVFVTVAPFHPSTAAAATSKPPECRAAIETRREGNAVRLVAVLTASEALACGYRFTAMSRGTNRARSVQSGLAELVPDMPTEVGTIRMTLGPNQDITASLEVHLDGRVVDRVERVVSGD